MQPTEEFQNMLSRISLVEREDMLTVLEDSIAREQQSIADHGLQSDLALCEERMRRYAAGQSKPPEICF